MREIALDTETTGLDPKSGHRIVEIGCVEMIGRVRTGKYFHAYLNPERDMPEEAFRVHGISGDFLKDKPIFSSVAEEFLDFLSDSTLIIHNAAFDMKFINFELGLLQFPPMEMSRAVDTVHLARKKFPGSPANLDALCKRFDIDLSARTKHGALLDAELLCEVYIELTGGRQVMIGFEGPKAGTMPNAPVVEVGEMALPARNFTIPDDELIEHKAFIQTLKNPLWLELEKESA